ncbi:MAG: 1-deoxy-D-xylulose-5-phosphate synthase [Planctomycetaceae bacterium]|jgi:1-deoxy-D-xylulose-5-phosphate synthase|nr:1-deoxy-D-xylulose-5-phosphate synthase [Planctomycetaceae bacterium]
MIEILPTLESPQQLRDMSLEKLQRVAQEIRDTLCDLLKERPAHFASNLGVVELCLALHTEFDFLNDRLIWDTGHQIYPQKLITGRYHRFHTIRTKGGLMGYPNPNESDYDLFVTGHAGSSVSTMVGLRSGDDLQGRTGNHSVAVIGDGAFPSGIVFEALNNAALLKSKMLVILNDNEMSICPRVGGLARYLDRLRANPFYSGLKQEIVSVLNKLPVLGDPTERMLVQIKEGVKAGLHGGMLFEEFGFKYFGPIDGHDIALLKKYLRLVKTQEGPVLLHVITKKGHGFKPAAADPVLFHTPPVFQWVEGERVELKKGSSIAYTDVASKAIGDQMRRNPQVTVITAAMCQGNKLEPVREEFPDRFFDVGICESHAVAFAGGQAKTGMRPIVDIYSTFLQRSFDQIFQEVCLQGLPVVFMMDRAGMTAEDGPTHHGTYDLAYMRVFPNMIVMAPGDGYDLRQMLDFSLQQNVATAIRYPKTTAVEITEDRQPIELGKSEIMSWGRDGMLLAVGTELSHCMQAAAKLKERGLDIGVINVRFIKPLDTVVMRRVLEEAPLVVTAEEGTLSGGFGSALLEFAADHGLRADHVRRLGVPDRFVEHQSRAEVLQELRLDPEGIVKTVLELAAQRGLLEADFQTV